MDVILPDLATSERSWILGETASQLWLFGWRRVLPPYIRELDREGFVGCVNYQEWKGRYFNVKFYSATESGDDNG